MSIFLNIEGEVFQANDLHYGSRDNGLAESVFRSLDSPGSAAYCTLLQGMTRFHQVDRAWQLYQEMQERGIPLTRDAYNSLIRVVCYFREGNEQRWQLIQVNGLYHYASVLFVVACVLVYLIMSFHLHKFYNILWEDD